LIEADILIDPSFLGGELDVDMFENTISQLPGPPAHIVRKGGVPTLVNGCYVLRVQGDPGFYRFAIDRQGYGHVVNVEVRKAPGIPGHDSQTDEDPGAETFDPFFMSGYFGDDEDQG
jgi:hypothetical protein